MNCKMFRIGVRPDVFVCELLDVSKMACHPVFVVLLGVSNVVHAAALARHLVDYDTAK